MTKHETTSNAQDWELEVICKNKEYLNKVVTAILEQGKINFEVERTDTERCDEVWTVFLWSSWFHNLSEISIELAKIEEDLEGFTKNI